MISVIIPTYNEGLVIRETVSKIRRLGANLISEVIVSDGLSNDDTISEAKAAGAKVILARKGRATQMNEGAGIANGYILYFLHADSLPPVDFARDIIDAVRAGSIAGCFELAFDYDHWFLKTQTWFTRFDVDAFRYGDQSLFVLKETFTQCKGFDSSLVVFEDNEIVRRIKRIGPFKILNTRIITSARKYRTNGVIKTQLVFYLLFICYKLKFSQDKLVRIFRACIKQDKV